MGALREDTARVRFRGRADMTDDVRSPLDQPDPKLLFDIARWRMPFGRYRGTRLVDLPEPYVVWFRANGFPRGRLGILLETLYDIKANGLEPLLDPLRDRHDPRYRPPPETRSPRSR